MPVQLFMVKTLYIKKSQLQRPASPAQVRLEFGLTNEIIGRMYSTVKLWYRLRQNAATSPNKALWTKVDEDRKSPYNQYLHKSLAITCTTDLWNKKLPYQFFKTAINKAAKFHSRLLDKNTFRLRSHAWMVINNYRSLAPAPYLNMTFSIYLKKQLMAIRFGKFPSIADQPTWAHMGPKSCRLCGYYKEDFIPIICICNKLYKA